MPARDYAASKGPPRRQTRKKDGMPGWVWMLVGLSIGLAIAAGFYITRPTQGAAVSAQAPPPKPRPAGKEPRTVELPPKEESRFSFYEILPSYEVVVPRDEGSSDRAPAKTPAAVPEPGTYVIQVGSFRAEKDADRMRANLALLGIESRIERVTIDNKDNWFRVRVGPEPSEARTNAVLRQLAENQIDAFLVRVDRNPG